VGGPRIETIPLPKLAVSEGKCIEGPKKLGIKISEEERGRGEKLVAECHR